MAADGLSGLDAAPSHNIGRFTMINLAGPLLSIVVSLIAVPAYLDMLGQARYGIWLVVWVLLGYLGLDLGLGRATANAVAKRRSAPAAARETVVWSGVAVNATFGIVLGALVLLGSEILLRSRFGPASSFHSELVGAAPWLAATLPLFIVGSVVIGALEGLERFVVVQVVATFNILMIQVAPLVAAAVVAPRLDVLAAATALALVVNTMVASIACALYLPLTMRPRIERSEAKALLQFGGWITVSSLISPLLTTLDKVIVGAFSGARAVAHYTVPFNLVIKLTIFPLALIRSLFPRFSRLSEVDARQLAYDASRALTATMTPIVVISVLAVEPFMQRWVGRAFASEAVLPAEIFLLGFWVNSLAFVPYTLLQARGRPDVPAKFHLLELPLFVGALWAGLKIGGVAGAAAAWSARTLLDTILLMFAANYEARRSTYLLPALTLMLAAFGAALATRDNLSARALVALVVIGASVAWAWSIAPSSLRRYALRLLPGRRAASITK